MSHERLDRVLAHLGLGSRREVRELIRAGRVEVAGRRVTDPAAPVAPTDPVAVDGRPLARARHMHLMLHKPAGVITATWDRRQPTVLDLVPPDRRRPGLYPVGRLDKDTEGLLILTTDGELGHRLLHPRRHVEKEYYVRLDGPVGPDDVAAFAAGLALDGGDVCRPARLVPGPGPEEATVVLTEGMYHQVRRMFAARGRTVLYLKRVRFGPLVLDPTLPPGACRDLAPGEVAALYRAAGLPEP